MLTQNLDADEPIALIIPDEYMGLRCDVALAKICDGISRTQIVKWLKDGHIIINDSIAKPKDKLYGGESVVITPIPTDSSYAYTPCDLPLDIIYEDEYILIINKPAGLVTHPGAGNWTDTLLNALLFHYPNAKNLPRAGIVHRLDKDTSGIMMIAKTLQAQTKLVQMIQNRSVSRIYRAIVHGHPYKSGVINKNIGRDIHNRTKMSACDVGGKEAITHFKVLEYFDKFSYIECKLDTGRTHQIRVHMKHIKHQIVGDKTYGYGNNKIMSYSDEIQKAILNLNRQALHAITLQFQHPITNVPLDFKCNLADDIKYLLNCL